MLKACVDLIPKEKKKKEINCHILTHPNRRLFTERISVLKILHQYVIIQSRRGLIGLQGQGNVEKSSEKRLMGNGKQK